MAKNNLLDLEGLYLQKVHIVFRPANSLKIGANSSGTIPTKTGRTHRERPEVNPY